jgi:hypothetical protein
MVIELIFTTLIDAIGGKGRKNTDKRNLKEAEGDPEEYERQVEKIENRKQNGNNFFILMLLLFIIVAIFSN